MSREEPSYVRISEHTHASDSRGDTVRRITKATLGGLAGCALVLGATQAAIGDSPQVVYEWSGLVSDLRPDVPGGPLDGASASIRITETPAMGAIFKLRVTDINLSAANEEFGAHLHVGPCTERLVLETDPVVVLSPDTTGAHYRSDSEQASPANEVWFDLVPENETKQLANDETSVKFEVKDTLSPGVMSIVLHEKATDPSTPNGAAGLREACLPVEVSQWAAY
jgi:superoxide dismutase, Cu-Zn family